MKIIRFIFFFVLLATSICWTGCEMFASHTDPIAGWQKDYNSRPGDQIIEKDYQDYIKGLGLKPKKAGVYAFYASEDNSEFVVSTDYFMDGTGQRAVKITIDIDHTVWVHVLIYDKDNKRIKTIKYVSGHVSC